MKARFLCPGLLLAAVREPLPPLRPPRGELPPSFWETYGWLTWLAVAALAIMGGCVWVWLRSRAKHELGAVDSLAIARAKLAALPGPGADPALVSQIVRWAILERFRLPWMEYTTEEFQAVIQENHWLSPELAGELRRWLADCDRARFAAAAPAASALSARGLRLLEQIAALTSPPVAPVEKPPVA
jgi:hypothetical protein